MDQTAFAHQAVLRHVGKRGEDPNVDRRSDYVLVAIVRKRLALDASLYTLLQIFSIALFEKMSINQALDFNENTSDTSQVNKQLNLFDF